MARTNTINQPSRYWIIVLLLVIGRVWSDETTAILQTQNKLRQLDNQINTLQQTLTHAHDKRGLLNQELASTEKQIGTGIRRLHTLQQGMDTKQQTIRHIEQRISELNKQLIMQQRLLAEHVRIRYKMGEYQPIKWLLNQDNPYSVDRLLTFHQYLIHSRQKIIDKIDATKKSLISNHAQLKTEIAQQHVLQQQLHVHQENLQHSKQHHTAVIQSLNNDIKNKQLILTEFQRNKENLSQLLTSIAVQSTAYADTSFDQMRHKLPKPINIERRLIRHMNQGVTFFVAEGTPVNAVYPGKVVFSDWLNGYGLLLIIDHGQGFMTLYAHNQSLFKHKGNMVQQGEQIAAVGHTGGIKRNGLYFEVRQHGKTMSPLQWLA